MRLRTRRSLTIPTIGPRRECPRHARSVSGVVVEVHALEKDGALLFFKQLYARINQQNNHEAPNRLLLWNRLLFWGPSLLGSP